MLACFSNTSFLPSHLALAPSPQCIGSCVAIFWMCSTCWLCSPHFTLCLLWRLYSWRWGSTCHFSLLLALRLYVHYVILILRNAALLPWIYCRFASVILDTLALWLNVSAWSSTCQPPSQNGAELSPRSSFGCFAVIKTVWGRLCCCYSWLESISCNLLSQLKSCVFL